MTAEAWGLFCPTEIVLRLDPGPAAGVRVANATDFGLSVSGLIALHSLSAQVFSLVGWGGAAHLVWLGAMAIWRSTRDEKPPLSIAILAAIGLARMERG